MQKDALCFVIHKHKTIRPHYDLRLEIHGIMPSWAISKGPTLDNTVKRLAMPTTDHEMDYRHFEGVIPEGSYGAGPVMIWDEGTYIAEVEIEKGVRKEIPDRKEGEKVMQEGLKKGELKFTLHGKKLHGSFALVKTKGWERTKRSEGARLQAKRRQGWDSWLLIKHNDDAVQKDYDANNYPLSAVSKKSIEEIGEEKNIK